MRPVSGGLWISAPVLDGYGEYEYDICIFYGGRTDGLLLRRRVSIKYHTDEDLTERFRVPPTLTDYMKAVEHALETGRGLNKQIVAFVRQWDGDLADRAEDGRRVHIARVEAEEAERRREEAEREQHRREEEAAKKAEEARKLHELYHGWLDDKHPMFRARSAQYLDRTITDREDDGRIWRGNRREFVEKKVSEGWYPYDLPDGKTHYFRHPLKDVHYIISGYESGYAKWLLEHREEPEEPIPEADAELIDRLFGIDKNSD